MTRPCIVKTAFAMPLVASCLLAACPCLAFVANVAHVANAASGISGSKRLWFPFDFAIIIGEIPFFLWRRSYTRRCLGVQTGFGRVGEYLLPALVQSSTKFTHCVRNLHGDHERRCRSIAKLYPAMAHGSDPFGSHRIGELVQTIKPDLVWVTNDLWIGISLWGAVKPFQGEDWL
jgi:hypothetical protein